MVVSVITLTILHDTTTLRDHGLGRGRIRCNPPFLPSAGGLAKMVDSSPHASVCRTIHHLVGACDWPVARPCGPWGRGERRRSRRRSRRVMRAMRVKHALVLVDGFCSGFTETRDRY